MTFVEGTVVDIIYRNEDNAYTVLELDYEGALLVCVGNIPFIQPGEYVRFYGAYTTHKSYGEQFKVASMESRMPEGDESIKLFLSGGLIKGVGEVIAARIVEAFHSETFDIIENHPEKLAKIKGISMTAALRIQADLKELTGVRSSVIALQSMGLTMKQAFAAYDRYGAAAADIIDQNPYRLIDDVYGIGFEKADKIAANIGIEKYSDFRIYYGIRHVLKSSMENAGHTCLPKDRLLKESAALLQAEEQAVLSAYTKLVLDGAICENMYKNTPASALCAAYNAESYCAYRLIELSKAEPKTKPIASVVREVLEGAGLSELQERAVNYALTNNLCIITGGPGTGKTTILNELITILERSGIKTALAAPTGRAAKRMEKSTSRTAQTIHRLLEYGASMDDDDDFLGLRFNRDKDNPIDAEAVIIDESSMVDVFLLCALLKAIEPGTRVIFTGDADQLPSVGPGNVLRDMIDSGYIPVARLTEVFRQKGNIAHCAHGINDGVVPDLYSAGDFVFIPAASAEDCMDKVKKLFMEQSSHGERLDDVQIICPIKRGKIGVYEINKQIREMVNPLLLEKNELKHGEEVFREGDKVMQTQNNYSKEWFLKGSLKIMSKGIGVFNGDMGVINSIDKNDNTIEIIFDSDKVAEYEKDELMQIEHAYAVTVHKSQGSEFDTVILPLFYGASPFLSRNLLYTAVTRAKKRLYIVGLKNCLEYMVKNNRVSHRFTALNYEMQKYAEFFASLEQS